MQKDPEPDREIVSTRVLDAPREVVFRAFGDPRMLARWWGPKGFTNTFHEFDLRPGGAWRFVMHGPDGTDYHNATDFIEVVRPERIVFRHLEPMHRFQMTMTFAEEAGKTRLTWRMRFDSAAELERVKGFVPAANEQNFDRLEEQLASSPGHFTPEGWPAVTPRIVAREASRLVEFVRRVFEATGEYRHDMPTVLRIGDSRLMISDAGARDPVSGFLYVYVPDADETYRLALQAGASAREEPADMPYGDRRGMVADEWGNTWQIATHRGGQVPGPDNPAADRVIE